MATRKTKSRRSFFVLSFSKRQGDDFQSKVFASDLSIERSVLPNSSQSDSSKELERENEREDSSFLHFSFCWRVFSLNTFHRQSRPHRTVLPSSSLYFCSLKLSSHSSFKSLCILRTKEREESDHIDRAIPYFSFSKGISQPKIKVKKEFLSIPRLENSSRESLWLMNLMCHLWLSSFSLIPHLFPLVFSHQKTSAFSRHLITFVIKFLINTFLRISLLSFCPVGWLLWKLHSSVSESWPLPVAWQETSRSTWDALEAVTRQESLTSNVFLLKKKSQETSPEMRSPCQSLWLWSVFPFSSVSGV